MMDADEALELGAEIIRLIEEELTEDVYDRATDFFDDVREKVEAVMDTIEENNEVTDRQASAFEGWHSGVSKWIR